MNKVACYIEANYLDRMYLRNDMTKGRIPPLVECVDRVAKLLVPYYSQGREITDLVSVIIGESRKKRAMNVIKAFHAQIEDMTESECAKLQEELHSDAGQEVIAEYIDTAINTPSKIAHTAIALLMANDPEYTFSEVEKERFIYALEGLNDRKIIFFIKLTNIETVNNRPSFPLKSLNNSSIEKGFNEFDVGEMLAYCQEFFNRGLILRNPQDNVNPMEAMTIPGKEDWVVIFYQDNTMINFGRLLNKARFIVDEGPSEA